MYERHSVRSAFLYGYFGRKEMKTMIDFSILVDYFVLVVVMACLIVGHIIKTALDFIPNKYIPTILAVVGASLNVWVSGLSLDSVVYGALMGLSSTGMHQAFTRFIENTEESEM